AGLAPERLEVGAVERDRQEGRMRRAVARDGPTAREVHVPGAAALAAHVEAQGGVDAAHAFERALRGGGGLLLLGELAVHLRGEALGEEGGGRGRRRLRHGRRRLLWKRFTLFTCSAKVRAKTCEPSLRETKNR